tara:strand:+ start:845 stop:1411 length:567 start_codon:yes stop_codon:yes gene_type:complete
MTLYFITGNKKKFEEAKFTFPEIEQLDIDLPEIQNIDAKEIIKEKLNEALKNPELKDAEFIVEDTSLYLDCLNGLPGPLIKWFMETIGNQGIYELTEKYGNNKAEAKTIIGYAKNENGNPEIYFFEGSINGEIVAPKGEVIFGWNPIFKLDGYDKTFGELSHEERSKISMRKVALNKLKEFLDKAENE